VFGLVTKSSPSGTILVFIENVRLNFLSDASILDGYFLSAREATFVAVREDFTTPEGERSMIELDCIDEEFTTWAYLPQTSVERCKD
jgi:hypothetical protein